jgi:hypothetical protein
VSLCKSPVRSPALLAANRARTSEGKARVALNTLKHARMEEARCPRRYEFPVRVCSAMWRHKAASTPM